MRNPERYFISIFGEPSETETWGYRLDGHHVSLHFTVVKGHVVGNPTFLRTPDLKEIDLTRFCGMTCQAAIGS